MVTDFCEDLLWAQRDKTSRDFMKYTYKNNNVVIPIQTFRRNLKELKPPYKRYKAGTKSYNTLKDVKEKAKTLHQRSNKGHRESVCLKPSFMTSQCGTTEKRKKKLDTCSVKIKNPPQHNLPA